MPRDPDPNSTWVEPDIVINGQQLSFAHAMAVRVAVTSFRMQCNQPNFARDMGEVAVHYDTLLADVEDKMRYGL